MGSHRMKKISAGVPEMWADELDRLTKVPVDEKNGPLKKPTMIRDAIRGYLQRRSPEKWEELELGPPVESEEPPPPIIDVEAVEIPTHQEEIHGLPSGD